jgi:hypothetical protein
VDDGLWTLAGLDLFDRPSTDLGERLVVKGTGIAVRHALFHSMSTYL